MAERAYNRRRLLQGISATETPPPRRATSPGQPISLIGAFPLVDLDAHPDRDLLKACSIATMFLDRRDQAPHRVLPPIEAQALNIAINLIVHTDAMTRLGIQAKALFVMGDAWADLAENIPPELYQSVIRDFIRVGVPA